MLLGTGRSPTRADLCDFNDLLFREQRMDVNTRKYLLAQTSTPISYRELRSIMTNRIPSHIVILPKPPNSTRSSTGSTRAKNEPKDKPKRTGFDVYKALVRSETNSLISFERDSFSNELTALSNSFTIDRLSPLSNNSHSRSRSLPKVPKQSSTAMSQISNSTIKKCYRLSPSLPIQHVERMPPSAPKVFHRTTPVDRSLLSNTTELPATPTVKTESGISDQQSRKQLHIYVP